MLQLASLQVGPDVPIQRHGARGKDVAGADITCQRSENTPIPLRHTVATGTGSHGVITETGKYERNCRERRVWEGRQFQ
jgi:hypothetical protein